MILSYSPRRASRFLHIIVQASHLYPRVQYRCTGTGNAPNTLSKRCYQDDHCCTDDHHMVQELFQHHWRFSIRIMGLKRGLQPAGFPIRISLLRVALLIFPGADLGCLDFQECSCYLVVTTPSFDLPVWIDVVCSCCYLFAA